MTRLRWMALCFALGSTCFLVGPFPGYLQLVGGSADAITFFVGSILFTAGGALQSWLAWDEWRSAEAGGRAAWWSAIVQSAGTLFFNVTTYQAMHVALTSSDYDKLVWRPDWRGSICFLVSGAIAYAASPRRGRLRMAAGTRRGRLVAAGRQPARLHLLRHLRRRGLRRAVDRLDHRSRRRQLEHVAGRGVLPRLCARHPAYRASLEDAVAPGAARARARARARSRASDLSVGEPLSPLVRVVRLRVGSASSSCRESRSGSSSGWSDSRSRRTSSCSVAP